MCLFTIAEAGSSNAAKMAIMDIVTSNSTRVNALSEDPGLCAGFFMIQVRRTTIMAVHGRGEVEGSPCLCPQNFQFRWQTKPAIAVVSVQELDNLPYSKAWVIRGNKWSPIRP